ncbi:PstS family phosphate ABC transporter substrate-binding protein [Streptomyces sp. NBC_01320]|uniref:PstS family phosphate ABC transporter substrate-binding protein n=1 Tax=Streptomyces sp. NBC_01320 TaxID=2903824 RepID=UPI002E0F6ACC|nr:substrate-binding domain-containing protein [Streptomyces sp. NBC_01320]
MKRTVRTAVALAVTVALAAVGTVTSAAGTDNSADDLTSWAIAPQKKVSPQTPEQDEYNKAHGRPLPAPELLQPALDTALGQYRPRPKNSLRGDYECGASDVLADLSQKWIKEFEKKYPKVHITVNPPYAGSLGALELIKGKLDCVFVSRELKPTDIQGFHDAFGYDPLSIPISGGSYRHFGFLDSVGFMVNKKNPVDKLSLDQLDAALSTTRHRGGKAATTWGDLGATGDWADKPVHIVGLQPWNGFEEFVRQRVLDHNGRRGEWRSGAADGTTPADPAVHWEKTVFNLSKAVADDPYAIGYTGMAYVDSAVKVISLGEHVGDPAYAPTYENVASAAYPLSRVTYLNVNKRPGKQLDPVMEELIRFILSKQGQQVVSGQQIFLPLRSGQTRDSLDTLVTAP